MRVLDVSLHRPIPPRPKGWRSLDSEAPVFSRTVAPCGCVVVIRTDDTMHLHPCARGARTCPTFQNLVSAARKSLPHAQLIDERGRREGSQN